MADRARRHLDQGQGRTDLRTARALAGHADEIPDVQNLAMWLDVNGERMQTGNTSTMIFSCAHIVSYCSQFMILEPGDVITTGTPPGVGLGMKPPRYLKPGDVVTLGIERLGEQRQQVRAYQG
jgi:2-keto-4-pentenoate hydratase/2-oxohepta-3-ene-1,7-dioic acid hydratase in catechol pathway